MAKTKKSISKSPAAQKVSGGPSGKMAKFTGADPQKPFVTARTNTPGKGAPFAKGGPSGGMAKFSPVKAQKAGRSGQS
jgi:hypothetical protein